MNGERNGVVIVILAAGTARRFGALKQLQTIAGISLLRRAAQTALHTGLRVLIVTGAEPERVGAELHDLPLHLLHNPNWARGMGGTLALAARTLVAASPAPDAVLVLLADQPLVNSSDLAALLHEHQTHPTSIIAADYGERIGPPCLFPSAYFDALAALDGDHGARALLQANRDAVRALPMPHAALDVDTPEDLARAAAQLAVRATSS